MLYNICDYIDLYKFSISIYSWKASPAQSAAQTAGQDTQRGKFWSLLLSSKEYFSNTIYFSCITQPYLKKNWNTILKLHNKEKPGIFLNFTLFHSPSDKPDSNPEGWTVLFSHLGQLYIFMPSPLPVCRDKPSCVSPCSFTLLIWNKWLQEKKKKKEHYHLGEASGVYRKKKKTGSMGKFIFHCYNQSLT